MKTLKIFIITGVIVLLSKQYLFAQTENYKETRKAQVTFAYPIGSAGNSSGNYANNFSFNILYGINGGVKGFELGSLWNHNNGDVTGFQLSGIVNTTAGNSGGLIISGVANYNKGIVLGAEISGVLNYTPQSLTGFQLAGVSNIGSDSLKGIAIAGVLNLTNGNGKGVHLSTINLAKDFEGLQLGVINSARRLKGVQIGVINIIEDGENALPIGLLSIVKNGYYEMDLTGGEAIYSNLSYKMGVERLYTIFRIGYSSYLDKPVYSYGAGFGTSIQLSGRDRLNVEVTSNQIYYNNVWDDQPNGLNKLDLNYKFNILEKLSLLIGPSFNIYLTKVKINGEYGTINIPYTVYEHEYAHKKLFMWIGLNAGVSINF
jgi:hypothetical protein